MLSWSCDSSDWSTSGDIKEWSGDAVPSWMWNVFSLWHWRTNILFMSCALLPNMFGSDDTLKTGKALHICILIHLQNSGLFWVRQTQVSYRGNHVWSNILSYPNTLVEFPTEVSLQAVWWCWKRPNKADKIQKQQFVETVQREQCITANLTQCAATRRLCSSPTKLL